MTVTCNFKNCDKRATYAFTYGKPDRCIKHKENRKPQYSICQCGKHTPLYNLQGETKPIYCSKCKTGEMEDVRNKRCQCGKHQPSFNLPGETTPVCCDECKTGEMVNVVKKRCHCGKHQPTFNLPGETTPVCCDECKTGEMVNVVKKRCQCGKHRPTFNLPGETNAVCCDKCKTGEMVDVLNKRCQCGKHRPTFNLPGETTPICCDKCKTGEMVNVASRKCQCGEHIPYFNLPGETTPICCSECKNGEMVNVVSKTCISGLCGGTLVKDDKYRGYCTHCFSNLFPTDPLTAQIRKKSKEIAVKAFINEEFKGFCHDKSLEFGCDCAHRRKVDHRKLIDGTMLCIETDENQHKGTSYKTDKEKVRYDDLVSVFTGKWIFIRYNPDKYKRKNGTKAEPTNYIRLKRLEREIEKQIKRIEKGENEELLEVIYLYYDGFT